MNRLQLFLSATVITAAFFCVPANAPASDDKQHKFSVPPGDYVNSSILQVLPDVDSIDVPKEISIHLHRAGSSLDLSKFTYVSTKLTKSDLKALSTPEARNRIKELHLHGLPLDDMALEAVTGMHLTVIDVGGTEVVDLHAIRGMQSLTAVFLSHSRINAAGMQVLAQLHNLSQLLICDSNVSDADLTILGKSKSLTSLNCVRCPKLSKFAIQQLKAKLPRCVIQTEETRQFRESNCNELTKIDKGMMGVGDYAAADRAVADLLKGWEARVGKRDYQSICDGYTMRGKCQQELNHPKEAGQFYSKALSISKEHNLDSPDLQSSFALFCEEQENFARANKMRELQSGRVRKEH